MNQLPFWPPVSRRLDPVSSHAAEEEINTKQTRRTQCELLIDIIKRHPGCTSFELTRYCRLDRYQIARRVADLENHNLVKKGMVRTCDVTGRLAVTWVAKEK